MTELILFDLSKWVIQGRGEVETLIIDGRPVAEIGPLDVVQEQEDERFVIRFKQDIRRL